ncbi:MAG: hypothetical protein ACYSXF_06250 [Planctomycetota bacterium]|jgi:hypothetical protein
MTAPADGPLSLQQIQEIAEARHRGRKVNRAAVVAAISGWTMAAFAAMALLSGLFSLRALILGVGLAITAFIELRGARQLRVFDLMAPYRLAANQVGVAVVVSFYAGWGVLSGLFGPGAYDQYVAAGGQMAEAIAPIDNLTRAITVAFYATVIACTVVAQGCGAAYYASRRAHMVAYLRDTPPWIADMLRVATS